MERELNWVIQYVLPVVDRSEYLHIDNKMNTNIRLTACPQPISNMQPSAPYTSACDSYICFGKHHQMGMDLWNNIPLQ